MKTLDEVIDAMERCSIPHYFDCKGCPYEDDDAEVGCRSDDRDADALHYLKTIETMENLYHDAVNKLSKWEDEDWKDRCLPLTWDELKQMEGKPVWIEHPETKIGRWIVIAKITGRNEDLACMNATDAWGSYWKKYQGLEWQAYRKERE